MQKKILSFILTIIIVFIHSSFASEKVKIVPIKKPLLTESELKKKILVNILKPLPKPKLNKIEIINNEIAEKKSKKPKFFIPKKKPLIAGKDAKFKIVKSKFYNKKDFAIAKKAVSEMLRVTKKGIFISDCNNFGQGSFISRSAKQVINKLGLWKVFDIIKTKGKGYTLSEGDGLAYSYSVFNDYNLIKKKCRNRNRFGSFRIEEFGTSKFSRHSRI